MIDEIKLTKNLIKINSTNPGKYEKEVFKFLEKLFKKEGVKYKKYLLDKDRPNLVIKIGNKDIKDNILFIGHLDSLPFDTRMLQSGFEEAPGVLQTSTSHRPVTHQEKLLDFFGAGNTLRMACYKGVPEVCENA